MSADVPTVWSERAGDPELPAVFLIHGSMDRSAGLLRLSRRLDRSHSVVRFDRRGYGRSIAIGPPHTVEANVDDLERLIDEHQGDGGPVALFGHSFGGNIALALAARRPELVSTVTVYETPMSWLSTWPGGTAGGAAMGAETPGAAAEAFIRRLVGDEVWDRLPPSKQEQRRAEGVAMVGELADLRANRPWSPEEITVPVLTMYGEHGRAHHRAAMEQVATLVADGRCVTIADAGHPGPHTHAADVAAAWTDFTASVGAG